MHVFVVFAHPNRKSLAGAVLDSFVSGLVDAGHTADISDLYREQFQPVFDDRDFAYYRARGPLPQDIEEIHRRISAADVLAFVFPLWWWSPPAIMRGWFDRVLVRDYAYRIEDNDMRPALAGKKVIHVCTAGSTEATLEKYHQRDAMRRLIDIGVWGYCGLRDVETHVLSDVYASKHVRMTHVSGARHLGLELHKTTRPTEPLVPATGAPAA